MNTFQVIGILALICAWTSGAPTEINDEDLKPEARIDASAKQQETPVQVNIAIPELRQTQYATSEGNGVYSFGYAYPEQMHTESRSSDGLVSGSYFYRDPEGNLNKVEYRADAAGFRVAANNLPVFNPEPVKDTPEVEEAKRKHLAAYEAIAQHIAKSQESQDEGTVNKEPVYVAPLDLEPLPESFVRPVEDKNVEVVPPKPGYSDQIIDEANQAVITNQEQADEGESIFEVDAEPVKLLAQFYSKHLKDNSDELKPVDRPAGFHPKNLEIPRGFDIFRRSEGRERDSIVITNPEYVDLKAFLQTQFRANQNPDLSLSDDMDPSGVAVPQQLINYYYGRPVFLSREVLENLPESLKLAAQKTPALDGQHTAQVAPSQKNSQLMQMRYSIPYSPFSSYYSPYYFFRQPYYPYYPYQPYYQRFY